MSAPFRWANQGEGNFFAHFPSWTAKRAQLIASGPIGLGPVTFVPHQHQGHRLTCRGFDHKEPDGVKDEQGHWDELSMHKGAKETGCFTSKSEFWRFCFCKNLMDLKSPWVEFKV